MTTDTVTTSRAYRKTLWLFLTIIVLQLPVQAQDSDSSRGASVGVNYQQLVPRGQFRGNTQGAPLAHQSALGVDLIFHLRSAVNLRLDFFFGQYDNYTCTYLCNGGAGFRAGGVAGELVMPRGPVRPYATAGLGRLSFNSFEYPDGTKADTGAGYWMYGGGVKIPLGQKWSVDLAGRYYDAGPVSYHYPTLRNPDGSVASATATVRSDIAFVMYMVGFQYRFVGRN
ncbi:MAG TPA: outer membrane beta-barrel protein [Terriglobia bacterium]|nr:outer membrane beta-barrel protein [Terriglobia bacterium]